MTVTTRSPQGSASPADRQRKRDTMAVDVMRTLIDGEPPVRITSYDGGAIGPPTAEFGLHIASERGLSYLLTAPGDLGLARAYVSGDLELRGVHPGDPYEALRVLAQISLRRPSPTEAIALVRGLGWERLRLPPPPPEEAPPRWRRTAEGLRHSRGRGARAVQHHYDVSNGFYTSVLGPSMTYTCAVYHSPTDTLETAQTAKYELVAGKLG